MNENLDPRAALRRMLIVLAIAIGFVIYSYGWTVTDIDLDKPQEEQRQTNVEAALTELLSPNIFDQEREVVDIYANFLIGCTDDGEAIEQPDNNDLFEGVSVTVEPDCGDPGDIVEITVRDFSGLAEGRIRWVPPGDDPQARPRDILETGREDFIFTGDGNFTGTIEVPRIRGTEDQISQIEIRAAVPIGEIELSNTSELVIDAMAETIFMALVATTIAIPIAAALSFFAARNIMRPIKLSLGGVFLAFIALAVGIHFGSIFLSDLVDLGVRIGNGDECLGGSAGECGAIFAFGVPAVVIAGLLLISVGVASIARRMIDTYGEQWSTNQLAWVDRGRGLLLQAIYALGILFLIGLIGGLGQLGSEQMHEFADTIRFDWRDGAAPAISEILRLTAEGVDAVANLLSVLSELVRLSTAPIAAFITGFVLANIVTELLSSPVRQTPGIFGYILGGVLGALAGAILMGVVGLFGTWAALLGLLSPIVLAVIGGQIPVMLYDIVMLDEQSQRPYFRTPVHNVVRTVLFWVGAVVTFLFVFEYLNIGRAVIDGTRPPDATRELLGNTIKLYIYDNMVIGAVIGGLAGLIGGVRANFPVGSVMYNVSRTILNTVRSIEPLIMGLVFVIWVGIGPFAGVMALTLHSIAALGKLYSEQVENIDDGPVEALNSTGASRLQTIIYAVVPQIVPPYVAFTMYRWDINVRMSTIIGFVGGGGVGLLLQQQINLLRYRDAGVAVLAIAVVVSILDYASASIRSRIM